MTTSILRRKLLRARTLALLVTCLLGPAPTTQGATLLLAAKNGIFRTTLHEHDGALGDLRRVDAAPSGFLALHPKQAIVYGFFDENGEHGVASYTLESDGDLRPQSRRALPVGGGTHLSVNPEGTLLATAHYGSGMVTVVAVRADGSLGDVVFAQRHEGRSEHPERQSRAHPHWTGFSLDGRFLFVPDLGTDEIWVYRVEANDDDAVSLDHRFKLSSGAGPRHLAFGPAGKFAYLAEELVGRVSALRYDVRKGHFNVIQTLDSTATGELATPPNVSEVAVHPSGRFVYVGNRGHDSISVFAADPATGKLTPVEREGIQGSWPRHFGIDRSGQWLIALGQRSNTVASFRIDPETGALTFSGHVAALDAPTCVVFPR